jgi:small ligand-binding sensory domain FIST
MPNRAVSRVVLADFSEGAVVTAAREARAELNAEVSVGIVFFSPAYADSLEEFLELLRVYGRIPLLIGCSGSGMIGSGQEAEDRAGFSLLLLSLPSTRLHVAEFSLADLEEGSPEAWRARVGRRAEEASGWVAFTHPSPARFDTERWLAEWNRAYPGVPVLGGIASGTEENTVVCHDGRAINGGAIVLGFSGGLAFRTLVSQGCRPIGEPLTITGVKQQNLLLSLGSKPAYSVLNSVFNGLTKIARATICSPAWP